MFWLDIHALTVTSFAHTLRWFFNAFDCAVVESKILLGFVTRTPWICIPNSLDLYTELLGFVYRTPWICIQNSLDLYTELLGFVYRTPWICTKNSLDLYTELVLNVILGFIIWWGTL
jgi:hypothetical protein